VRPEDGDRPLVEQGIVRREDGAAYAGRRRPRHASAESADERRVPRELGVAPVGGAREPLGRLERAQHGGARAETGGLLLEMLAHCEQQRHLDAPHVARGATIS